MTAGASAQSGRTFVISREFDAPPALVFEAWTNPRSVEQWWGPKAFSAPVCDMDVRPGGAYRIVMQSPDGVDYPITGNFLEIDRPKRLVMTMDCSGHPAAWHDLVDANRSADTKNPAGKMVTTVTFDDLGGTTRLTIQTQFETAAIRSAMVKMGMHEGWSESLDRLATHLART